MPIPRKRLRAATVRGSAMPGTIRPVTMNEHTPTDPRLAAAVQSIVADLEKGDRALAVSKARSALRDGLVHPLFLNLKAFWLEGRGRMDEALAELERAAEIAPDDVPVLNALGLALSRKNRHIEAAKVFERVIAVQPDFTPAYFSHGWACEMWGELDAAKTSYETVVARSLGTRDSAEPLARLATLAIRRGDWREAARLAEQALALAPNHPTAGLAQARAEGHLGDPASAERQLEQLLTNARLDPNDRYHAMGALAELCHRQKRYADAFKAYATGNAQWRSVAHHRYGYGKRVTGLSAIRWMRQYYDGKPAFEKTEPAPCPAGVKQHVFLLGFIRSGTTLLEQILASHPDIVAMEEKEALGDSGMNYLVDVPGLDRMHEMSGEQRARHVEDYWMRVREHGLEPAGKIFIDKQPFNTLKLSLISSMFPNAKILFAIRDPRDVVFSCFRQRFLLTHLTYELLDIQDAATFYAEYMQLADRLLKVLPLDLHRIRHEDLLDDFEGEVAKVCDFLQIEWTDSMRDFADRRKVRAIASPSAAQIAKGLNRSGVGQWRLYREHLAPALPILAPWVQRFGYPED